MTHMEENQHFPEHEMLKMLDYRGPLDKKKRISYTMDALFYQISLRKNALKQAWGSQEEKEEIRYAAELERNEIYVHRLYNVFLHILRDSQIRLTQELGFAMIREMGINPRTQHKISWAQFIDRLISYETTIQSDDGDTQDFSGTAVKNQNQQGSQIINTGDGLITMSSPYIRQKPLIDNGDCIPTAPIMRLKTINSSEVRLGNLSANEPYQPGGEQEIRNCSHPQIWKPTTVDRSTQRPGTLSCNVALNISVPTENANVNHAAAGDTEWDVMYQSKEILAQVDFRQMTEENAIMPPPTTSAPVFRHASSKKRSGKTLFRILSKPFTSKKT